MTEMWGLVRFVDYFHVKWTISGYLKKNTHITSTIFRLLILKRDRERRVLT
jgi:hypothetical protein